MNYLLEWQQSCVDEQLIRLNVSELEGSSPSEYLLYSDELPRRNDGRLSDSILKRYEHAEAGGWWCSGVDLLTGKEDLWGCFKPKSPRLDPSRQKFVKYEHPPKTPTGIFALRVPPHLWQRIAARSGEEFNLPRDPDPRPDGGEFWQWLADRPTVPLCITEGAKKAGALLTAGYAAIALPGIYNGYRVPRDGAGNRMGRSHLIPQLQKLAAPNREIYLAFDRDRQPATRRAVNTAIRRLGYLLTQAGCAVKVIAWDPELGKGADDVIAKGGESAFEAAYQNALPLEIWKAKELFSLTHPPDLQFHCRYLPEFSIPEAAKLIGLKSPKGTGKTQCLEKIVAQAIEKNQSVLVIGHRVRLVEELCQRFGLHYITEIRDNPGHPVGGYGLCIDSLHPNSQAKFKAGDWSDSLVIIDEVEQVLWHGLNSDTCKDNRVAILKSLKTLLQDVLGEGAGKVVVADADLSDISLEYLTALSGIPLTPFTVQNEWTPSQLEAWKVHHYRDRDPKRLLKDLVNHIRQGGKPFVCLSAQKLASRWGTRSLEAYLKEQFPQARILRVDSESLAEPLHPAYNCITRLDSLLSDYDIVLASPSIETGVSIDLRGHFTSVWAIAQGIQTATSVCQALARVRDNIPRHIWVAPYGFNQVGNGATSIAALLTSGHRMTQLNIHLLQQSDFESLDDFDATFQAESLLCWAKMAVRTNACMLNYRDSILTKLREESHEILEAFPFSSQKPKENLEALLLEKFEANKIQNQLMETIEAVREQNYRAECEAIAAASELTDEQYRLLRKRPIETPKERRALRKYELKGRYGIPVTPQLIVKDDGEWYQKLRLHYFLTVGRKYLADRDTIVAKKLIDSGNGSLFLPDFNSSQLGTIIATMEVLKVPLILRDCRRKLHSLDPDLQAIAEVAIQNRSEIKNVIGIGLPKNASPILIIRRFLDRIGYGLTCIGSEKIQKKSVRLYQVVQPQDGREDVFEQWLARDEKLPGSSEFWFEGCSDWLAIQPSPQDPGTDRYVQLSLNFE